ncbi:MAG: tetratricopeptide repeat protein [Planctomycetaceae bacterium]|nr:tetratricopeptide repeat protein [Planctomycetaceae bacterium]
MDRDPYELCPCGSGNKLKFCCIDVAPEMGKIERLLANNQPRMALQSLEKLLETHQDSQWVRTLLASTLINEDRADEAKRVLAPLLKEHPQQPFANVLYALASFNADGYPECKRAVHRAFKQSMSGFPHLVGMLASAVANHFESTGAIMGARQHRVLSLKLARDDQRRELFEDLVALDSESSIPYPLRSVHNPVDINVEGEDGQTVKLSARLSSVGCWAEAADKLATLLPSHENNPDLHYTLGLYRAWDGDNSRAVEAFRKAASLYEDFDTAVDCEVLAQLLERSDPTRGHRMRLKRFDLESVSQVLSRLDDDERIARLENGPDVETGGGPAGRYVILDRAISESEDFSNWGLESVPLIDGRLTIFDRDDQADQPAQAFLVGLEGPELDRAVDTFMNVVGTLAKPVSKEEDERPETDLTGHISPEELPLRWSGYVPPEAPTVIARRMAESRWQQVVNEIWPNTPCQALSDRSPLEAAGDDAAKVALAAALIVFDAYADTRNYMLDVNDLRERFQISPPAPIDVDEKTNVNGLTITQIHRVKPSGLPQEQLEQLIKRTTLVRHSRLLYEVMQEALQRTSDSDDWKYREQILATLASVCGNALRHEETLGWIAKGRALAAAQEHPFEHVLEWKMRELTLRIEDADDPELSGLLNDLWQNYGAKLPQLREYLVMIVNTAGITPPWESAIVTPTAPGSLSGEIRPPHSSSAEAAGKKLWLPGDGD